MLKIKILVFITQISIIQAFMHDAGNITPISKLLNERIDGHLEYGRSSQQERHLSELIL